MLSNHKPDQKYMNFISKVEGPEYALLADILLLNKTYIGNSLGKDKKKKMTFSTQNGYFSIIFC